MMKIKKKKKSKALGSNCIVTKISVTLSGSYAYIL